VNMQGYGFTFDGVHSDAYNIYFEKSYHPLTPPLTAQIQTVPKMPGGWYYRTDLGPRIIQLDIAVKSDSLANFRPNFRSIASWLDPAKGLKTLTFDNDPDVSYQAVLYNESQAVIINQLVLIGLASIYFLCPDPYGYGAAAATLNIPSGTASKTLTLESVSTDCFPVINVTFAAAATEYKITHSESGEFVRVIYNFVANDRLLIDCTKGLIQINGVDQMQALDINSDFFSLVSGTNTFTIAPSNVGTTAVDHTPRYL
jgi:predicted phage tail component-like protein